MAAAFARSRVAALLVLCLSVNDIGQTEGHVKLDRENQACRPSILHGQPRSFLAGTELSEEIKRAKLAREGHAVAWEFAKEGGYSGRMLIDGEVLSPSEATRKFLQKTDKE